MVDDKLFLNSAVKSLIYGIHFRAARISITVNRLDDGFFRVRFDKPTPKEKKWGC